MKRVTVWCLAGLLALAVGCGKEITVIRLKTSPETDMSALDALVESGSGTAYPVLPDDSETRRRAG